MGHVKKAVLQPGSVTVQMNFGAVLRCAHFLGVEGVLACSRNSAPLSAATSKASAGAMEVTSPSSPRHQSCCSFQCNL